MAKKIFYQVLFPIILLLLPLRHIFQGIDISDTGYNLTCFRDFGKLDGMWVYVTYLANAVGHIFTKLPFGNTMAGMNVYCSLVVSLMALAAYYFLQKKFSPMYSFAGILLAILLCWCPQVILYNYLTYFVLMAGTILLYYGVIKEKRILMTAAGVVLGIGVGVRFSNLTHMALILGLWYYNFLKKTKWQKTVFDTAAAIAGYVVGIGLFLGMIQLQYGLSGYWTMLFGLKTMSSGGASGYSAADMLLGAFTDYAGSMKWGVLFLLYMGIGIVFLAWKCEKYQTARRVLYVAGIFVLLKLVYARGMFGTEYHTYWSIFWWVSLFNTAALLFHIAALFRKDFETEEKVLFLLILVTILILPLGSNNRSYPVINNLFLIAPSTLYLLGRMLPKSFPVHAVTAACLAVLFIQSAAFGTAFVFRDGSADEKRDTKVENNGILKGMYTTKDNAETLTELTDFTASEGLTGKPVILYGDIPGLSYLLQMPSAITSTWSNLESYNMIFWERDFGVVEKNIQAEKPVVMIGKDYEPVDQKAELLQTFLDKYGYAPVFENKKVIVYH